MSRWSKQKDTILQVVRNAESHPQANWVYDQVRQEIPNISLGTVYRNLKLLAEAGEIRQLDISNGTSRFDGVAHSHYHFRCEKCGRVTDIDEPVNKELDRKVALKTGLQISHHQLEFRGVCKDCQRKNKT